MNTKGLRRLKRAEESGRGFERAGGLCPLKPFPALYQPFLPFFILKED